ncbi:MAG: hypothetical protein IPQ05_05945 [Leptospiraceae bacterium]|nr:hypothetical protein [Leptospiraceae bacterium]MBL0263415.1 hypothetical protein [Leptospiraceae bacterium]
MVNTKKKNPVNHVNPVKERITTGFQDYQDLQDCLVNTKKKNPVNHVNPVKEKDYDRISGLSGFTGLCLVNTKKKILSILLILSKKKITTGLINGARRIN